ncbi:MAG: CTP--2,3-di-O-geranylgeranyl-sn-glycero-1-phosphate cytidyltransferase [Candidatus Nanoarchaeia archaeon]
MAWDFKKEVKRKAIHLLSLFFLLSYIFFGVTYGKRIALTLLVLLLIIFLEIDYVRVELRKKIPFVSGLWREKEGGRLGGQVFFLIGAIISLAVFDFRIAIAALLMTTFGDMAASLVGKRFGRTWWLKDRAAEGILAEFTVNLVIGALILNNIWVLLTMAVTATVVETLVYSLDDNLIIPVFAGFNGQVAMWIIQRFF